ncbi:hypothetical protein BJ684DRAFT_14660 [Piptocephalis cylindrospora]|uniref:Uncharacterized protein n=1 Tax=Piptocephalis cylindrospora TaxID=1907219 RepID=A0A4P9Y7K1_9FUNG|nr:hypothetical protein BJ684DRAFT_14660 [Piptocephalis cylindrospora]|eukprot:RKP15058.1 hypothetical protein BJ684DRAFT_14660 [Piptocephalis cylindrospora]
MPVVGWLRDKKREGIQRDDVNGGMGDERDDPQWIPIVPYSMGRVVTEPAPHRTHQKKRIRKDPEQGSSQDWSSAVKSIHRWAIHTMGYTGPGLAMGSAHPLSFSELDGVKDPTLQQGLIRLSQCVRPERATVNGLIDQDTLKECPVGKALEHRRVYEMHQQVEAARRAWEDRLGHSQSALQKAQAQKNRVLHRVREKSVYAVKDRSRARKLDALTRGLHVLLSHYHEGPLKEIGRSERNTTKSQGPDSSRSQQAAMWKIRGWLRQLTQGSSGRKVMDDSAQDNINGMDQETLEVSRRGSACLGISTGFKGPFYPSRDAQETEGGLERLIQGAERDMYRQVLYTIDSQSTLLAENEEAQSLLEREKEVTKRYRELLAEKEAEEALLAHLSCQEGKLQEESTGIDQLESQLTMTMDYLRKSKSRIRCMNSQVKDIWGDLRSIMAQTDKKKKDEAIPLARWIGQKGAWDKEGGMSELEETCMSLSFASTSASPLLHRTSLSVEDAPKGGDSIQLNRIGHGMKGSQTLAQGFPGIGGSEGQSQFIQKHQRKVLQACVDRVTKDMDTSYPCSFQNEVELLGSREVKKADDMDHQLKRILDRADEARTLIQDAQKLLQHR